MNRVKEAVLIAGNGFDNQEVTVPLELLPKAGIKLDIATIFKEPDVEIDGKGTTEKPGFHLKPTVRVGDLRADDYDAVLLPGGHEGPDRVRGDENAIRFVQDMNAAGKIVAAICHGPWVLCTAEVLKGRRATCYPNMSADLVHAGAQYVQEKVVVEGNLITADRPETSEAWCEAIVKALST